jgi:hypothetical protein
MKKSSSTDRKPSIERIIRKSFNNGKAQYFVKWRGLPNSKNSWESLDESEKHQKIIFDFEKKVYGAQEIQTKETAPMSKEIKKTNLNKLSKAKGRPSTKNLTENSKNMFPDSESPNQENTPRVEPLKPPTKLQKQNNFKTVHRKEDGKYLVKKVEKEKDDRSVDNTDFVNASDPSENLEMKRDPHSCYDISSESESDFYIASKSKPKPDNISTKNMTGPKRLAKISDISKKNEVNPIDSDKVLKAEKDYRNSNKRLPAAPKNHKIREFMNEIPKVSSDDVLGKQNQEISDKLDVTKDFPNDENNKKDLSRQQRRKSSRSFNESTNKCEISKPLDVTQKVIRDPAFEIKDKMILPPDFQNALTNFHRNEIKDFKRLNNLEIQILDHFNLSNETWFNISIKIDSEWKSLGYFSSEQCRMKLPQQLCSYYEKFLKTENSGTLQNN